MNIGMLWFDNDPKTTLQEKIQGAVKYYREKYGLTPSKCVVNPTMLPQGFEEGTQVADVYIFGSKFVLPNHFFVGVKEP